MKKIFLISFIALTLFLTFGQVQAAGLVPCGGYGEPSCTFCHFFEMINNIIRDVLFKFVPAIAALMLVVGGILFLFAGVNPEALNQAKGIMTSVVIGLVIILGAWIIINTILTQIGIVSSPSVLQWYQIGCSI